MIILGLPNYLLKLGEFYLITIIIMEILYDQLFQKFDWGRGQNQLGGNCLDCPNVSYGFV